MKDVVCESWTAEGVVDSKWSSGRSPVLSVLERGAASVSLGVNVVKNAVYEYTLVVILVTNMWESVRSDCCIDGVSCALSYTDF